MDYKSVIKSGCSASERKTNSIRRFGHVVFLTNCIVAENARSVELSSDSWDRYFQCFFTCLHTYF